MLLRRDAAAAFPFAAHGAEEVWRRYVSCSPGVAWAHVDASCDLRALDPRGGPLEARAEFLRACFRLAAVDADVALRGEA